MKIKEMENQRERTGFGKRLLRVAAILLAWITAYLVYARTSAPPSGHPSMLGFLIAIRLELVTLGFFMAETFSRNIGLPSNVINHWIWPFWLVWLAVAGSLHYLIVKNGWVIAFVALTLMLSVSSYQFNTLSMGSWW